MPAAGVCIEGVGQRAESAKTVVTLDSLAPLASDLTRKREAIWRIANGNMTHVSPSWLAETACGSLLLAAATQREGESKHHFAKNEIPGIWFNSVRAKRSK